jgi:hypothetical protein
MINNYKGFWRGSEVDWGTILQARRSWVRFTMRLLDSFSWPNPFSCTIALGLTRPLTEISTGNILAGKGRSARKTEYLTAICEPIVYKMREPWRLTTLWASTACYRNSFTFSFSFYCIQNVFQLTSANRHYFSEEINWLSARIW